MLASHNSFEVSSSTTTDPFIDEDAHLNVAYHVAYLVEVDKTASNDNPAVMDACNIFKQYLNLYRFI